MGKNNKKGKNRKTTAPVLQQPLERQSLQEPKGDNELCSSQAQVQIPEPESPSLILKKKQVRSSVREKVALLHEEEQLKELPENHTDRTTSDMATSNTATSDMDLDLVKVSNEQETAEMAVTEISQPMEALDIKKEKQTETNEHPAQPRLRLQVGLSHVAEVLQNQALMWSQDRSILLGEIYKLRAELEQAKENQKHQASLQAKGNPDTCAIQAAPKQTQEVPANKDHQCQEKNSCLLAEAMKENESLKAALYQTQVDLKILKQQWGKVTSHLFEEQKETCRLKVALHQAHEDLKKQKQEREKDTSNLLSEQEETCRFKAALTQAQEDLKNQKQEWEKETSNLLSEQEETCRLKAALTKALENLKTQKQEWEKETSNLLSEQEETCRLKAALTQALENLKTQKKESEKETSNLLSEQEETCRLKAALYQAQDELKKQQQEWNNEKSGLLEEQKETTSKIKAALFQAEERLKTQRCQWEKDRFQLLVGQMEEKEKMKTAQKQAEDNLRCQWKEDMSCHEEETIKIQDALKQANMDLQKQKREWDMDRSLLLAEQYETLKMKTSLDQAKEDLQKHQVQWQQERASLMESLAAINKSLEEEQEERAKTNDSLMDRLRSLETQVEEARRPPKKSFKKRFLLFFKRDTGTPSQTSDTHSQDPSTPQSSSHSHQTQKVKS
ncbi:golgin subfamily A member 6-like protein 22 isoform X1 [Notolabrus celidotus]|uniref:golgin subfamily A member 6-like protein 22 isoform X1 n=1 Tax=Notolabrus celidotus TaxID=1203425 RepID=UPI0014903DEC|nr:golgin subfamily A member 6-like protein 22 isoform X1 [Notolabrus celidotus]